MKRLVVFILAALLAFSAFSCAKSGSSEKKPTYGYESVTLEGIELSDYTIVVSKSNYAAKVEPLIKALARYGGSKVPVKELSKLTEKDKNVILIGASELDGSHGKYWGLYGYRISAPMAERVKISIDFSNVGVLESAINRLVSLISRDFHDGNAVLTLTEKDCVGYAFEDKIPRWILQEESTSVITDGVTYTYQYFTDEDGLPYRAHVLKIDPTKAYLYMGTASDSYDFVPQTDNRQTVLQHINAAADNGITPVAGVNADFFRISTDYSPLGLCIKEGKVIADTRGRPWCGFTYDGTFVCGSSVLYKEYKGNLRTAVGASSVLVSNGNIATNSTEGVHPRTLAGVSEDGTIILAVIDGRQKNLSNGAVFVRCAAFMLSHGAYNAVNLDGGGSSTMIISQDGGYKTVNSPSDGHLRKVYNSLLVVPINK